MSEKKTRVIIGVPSMDMVYTDFALSLMRLACYTQAHCKDIELLGVSNVKSSIIMQGRNWIVDEALASKADKILWVDSDMTFPPHTLEALFNSGKDYIGCNCSTRRAPFHPTVRDHEGAFQFRKEGVHEVGYIGTGVLLTSTKIFEEIGKPYFTVDWVEERNNFFSEDNKLCSQAKEKGYKLYCDFTLSLEILHIGTATYGI